MLFDGSWIALACSSRSFQLCGGPSNPASFEVGAVEQRQPVEAVGNEVALAVGGDRGGLGVVGQGVPAVPLLEVGAQVVQPAVVRERSDGDVAHLQHVDALAGLQHLLDLRVGLLGGRGDQVDRDLRVRLLEVVEQPAHELGAGGVGQALDHLQGDGAVGGRAGTCGTAGESEDGDGAESRCGRQDLVLHDVPLGGVGVDVAVGRGTDAVREGRGSRRGGCRHG